MFERVIDRWHVRYAERIYLQALQETYHDRPKMTIRLFFSGVLSGIVLLSPVVVIGVGLGLIVINFPNIFSIIIGLILVVFGYLILPKHGRFEGEVYGREELPALFELLDKISAKLGTTSPDGVHMMGEFNAFIVQTRSPWRRRETWTVGIGFPLWEALTGQERVAVLAHEMAHRVNDDPQRSGIFFSAQQVLYNWHETFEEGASPQHIDQDVDGLVRVFFQFAGFCVEMVYGVVSFASFLESQRAEYRADAYASRVCGAKAMIAGLEKLNRATLSDRAVLGLYPYKKDQNGRVFDHMAHSVANANSETVERYNREAAEDNWRVDVSHPPTAMRIAFMSTLEDQTSDSLVVASQQDFAAIDTELRPYKDKLGKAFMQQLNEEEFNR